MTEVETNMNNALSEQLRNSADAAIAATVEKQCRRHPEALRPSGAGGLELSRADIRQHIDNLCAALDSGRNQPFADYLCWLAETLNARGVEVLHLNNSLDDLSEFYCERLRGTEQTRILELLAAGRKALAQPAALLAELRHLPLALPQKHAYLDLLMANQCVAAYQLVHECMTAGASLATVNVRIIQAAMYDVGRLWQANRISVAREHLATAISQYVMSNAFSRADFAPPMARTAIFANVESNHHALGLRMISDAFETAGWTAHFLGADMPEPALVEQIDTLRPDLLGLSVSMPQQLETARRIIGGLRAEMGQACPVIMLGGRAINAHDDVWRDLGADLWVADAEQAEQEAKRFGAGQPGGGADSMELNLVRTGASGIPASLRRMTSLVVARLNAEGRLLDANLGFWQMIGREPLPPGCLLNVEDCFVNPQLAEVLSTARTLPPDDTLLFEGLLTIGNPDMLCQTVRGAIHRDGPELLLAAEHDVTELGRVATEVLRLNAELADAQRRMKRQSNLLTEATRKLEEDILRRQSVEAELKRQFEELSALHAELKQTQQQLAQSEKLASIGQLAAGVAHEINNPIGFVHSNLGALERYYGKLCEVLDGYREGENLLRMMTGQPECAAWLARMEKIKNDVELDYLTDDIPMLLAESKDGIVRVKQIVADLRDFSRIDSGQQWEWVDLRSGLDSTLNIVSNELKYRADVVKQYGDLPQIKCLPLQLNQVFLNLLVNAAQAIPEGRRGTVTMRCGAQGDGVWVEIVDDGVGIPEENLRRIFDPFFTTKPIGKGTGLGLSLSYGIVQKHGGKIEVDSEVGVGTTFRISLPLSPPDQDMHIPS